jgi:O-antigen/teichoic acid export membrane protein
MVFTKLILFFVYLVISVMTVRLLGKEQFGIFSICANIGGLIGAFCCLGLGAAYFRFVPELVVHKNKAGLKRLITRSVWLQSAAVMFALVLVIVGKPWFDTWFNVDFRYYLILTVLLVGVGLLKDGVAAIETSMFHARQVSLLSFVQAVLWLIFLAVGLRIWPGVGSAINAQTFSYGIVYVAGAIVLMRRINRLNWRSPPYGIGKRRTLKYSGVIYLNSIIRLLMLQYTEVIFLGRMRPPGEVGAYALGYSLPPQIIFFIPAALQMLFTAGFSDAYSRDPNCLNRLIAAFYKMQILFTVPLAVFGAFFAPFAVPAVFGDDMALAGIVASAFCIIHLFPMISTPLSMAIQAKEKVYRMLPLMLLQISVNLFLDWLLILHLDLGIWGGMMAVAFTFLLTIPFRLRAVRSIIGGIYFPVRYLLRITLPLALLSAFLYGLSERFGLLALFADKYLNLLMLFVLGGIYLLGSLLMIRTFHLVRREDIADFHALDIPKLNFFLDLLVSHSH